MVIYCTYDKDNSTLVSRHRYVVAQNNNLSDRINIKCTGMTDPAAYGYYIDFVCMTHGGAAKAAYSSPALEYGEDGLNFDIPNCLTQYEGYVDAQLVIYEKSRASVVAKSVGRTGGIFEVAASVNALETRVVEPANMLTELSAAVLTANNLNTEVAKTVEEARVVKADIENTLTDLDVNFTDKVADKMKEIVKTVPVAAARLYFYDKLVVSYTLLQGNKIPVPEYDFPDDCVCEGWYSVKLGRRWDFEKDVVGEEDVLLYADCHNKDNVSVSADGTLTAEGSRHINIYLPFEFGGVKVVKLLQSGANYNGTTVYVNDADYKFVNPLNSGYVAAVNSRYIGGEDLVTLGGVLKAPNWRNGGYLKVNFARAKNFDFTFDKCVDVYKIDIYGKVSCPLSDLAKNNFMVFVIEIRGYVNSDSFVGDYFNLQAVILSSVAPELCKKIMYTSKNANCKIYALSDYVERYKDNGYWDGVEILPMSEFHGLDYTQIIFPTPDDVV